MSVWRFGAFAGALALAVGLTAGASAAKVPNPCTVVSASTVSSAVGDKGAMLVGKLSTRPGGLVKQTLCTYTQGAATLQIIIAPHVQSGGSGGPPGMVLTHPSGFGAGDSFAYGTNPHFLFATMSFTKAGLDGTVYSNGKYPRDDILALARRVYAAI
jgi:hypothetical protein